MATLRDGNGRDISGLVGQKFFGQTYTGAPRPNSNYAEDFQDFQIRTIEEGGFANKLGVTAAQLITNPSLSTDANALAKYTGMPIAQAQYRISTLGGLNAPVGGAGSFEALEAGATAREQASGIQYGAGGINPIGQQQPVSFPKMNLQPGMNGPEVKQLQDYLVSKGYMTREQVNTGYGNYGPQTTAAVLQLQKDLGIDYSSGPGYFGPKTLAGLSSGGTSGGTSSGMTADGLSKTGTTANIKGFADTVDYSQYFTGGGLGVNSGDSGSSSLDDLFKKYIEGGDKPTDLSKTYDDLSDKAGIDEKEQAVLDQQKAVKSAQNELALLQANLADINARGQQAQLTLEKQSGGRDITSTFLGRKQQEISRMTAIDSLGLQSQILGAQAKIVSAQGDREDAQTILDMANKKLDTAFKLQADYIEKVYAYNQSTRDKVWEYMSERDKERSSIQQRNEDRAYQLLRDNINYSRDLANTAIANGDMATASKIAGLNPASATYQQELAKLAGQIKAKAEKPQTPTTEQKDAQRVKNAQATINKKMGGDKKIAWETYAQMAQDWISQGGTVGDFKVAFPPETLMDKGNQDALPPALKSGGGADTKWENEKAIWQQLNSAAMINQPDEVKANYVRSQGFNPSDFDL